MDYKTLFCVEWEGGRTAKARCLVVDMTTRHIKHPGRGRKANWRWGKNPGALATVVASWKPFRRAMENFGKSFEFAFGGQGPRGRGW